MSVTSILSYYNKDYKDFRALLNQEVPKPKLPEQYNLYIYNRIYDHHKLGIGTIPPILAPCQSLNFGLVGTAFDYYLRGTIEKNFKNVLSTKLVSESAINKLLPHLDLLSLRYLTKRDKLLI